MLKPSQSLLSPCKFPFGMSVCLSIYLVSKLSHLHCPSNKLISNPIIDCYNICMLYNICLY